jgi:hypothetical protein
MEGLIFSEDICRLCLWRSSKLFPIFSLEGELQGIPLKIEMCLPVSVSKVTDVVMFRGYEVLFVCFFFFITLSSLHRNTRLVLHVTCGLLLQQGHNFSHLSVAGHIKLT